MPVSMSTCWEAEDCEAWVFGADGGSGKCGEEGRGSRAPPSRESETWTLVSFVSRFMRAVRAGLGCSEPMVDDCVRKRLWVEGSDVVLEGTGEGGGLELGIGKFLASTLLPKSILLSTPTPAVYPNQMSGFGHGV